ncbi:LuxR C-terminal-related transcriptional regulator [Pseudooctadecabacter jejudonensis]|uniref:Alpha/beta hydrolase family protein n=1 Tax=Pseudooctadecabacter jejudonensis TaxID=1391910 RepID=A0A1Y5TFU3_9RHOB|nr:LuxR C-terminal-related transcriptional regulator [Pseudooctadecabacter jejudonensis]SLN60898.1 Alpha/beta hydrolase family protein [Pseudooctadecabacter jejudonensis]
MTQKTPIDPDAIVDQLYDIALDTDSLLPFMEAWNAAGLDAQDVRQTVEHIDQFDTAYQAHLTRAETFLRRDATRGAGPDFAAMLSRFHGLAAFIVDATRSVAATNDGARHGFSLEAGQDLSTLDLPAEAVARLRDGIDAVLASPQQGDKLLKITLSGATGTLLFQLHRLAVASDLAAPHVLVVTTHFHWQDGLGQTLEEVFGLTPAEQGIVRALVEGQNAKTISANRGTSEGTVRGQIKTVLAKMSARSQSEVIRLVLSLRDFTAPKTPKDGPPALSTAPTGGTWLQAEVWKPFKTVTLPDGRRMDYHDMGPVTGAPILYTHMGYCMARWAEPMIKLCFQLGLRVIVPIRAGYGQSDNMDPKGDVLASTRDDTLFLLRYLGIARLPYVTQGGDFLFGIDMAAHHPEVVSELGGICARPSLSGDRHYSTMGKWHRFFLSTGKHAPHLLKFTVKAAVTMCKRIGVTEMFIHMNKGSKSDMSLLEDPHIHAVMIYNAELAASKSTDISQAFTMEVMASEKPWDDLMERAKDTPTWLINGADDPSTDLAAVAEYKELYPWLEIDVIPDGGQMMMFKHYDTIIPRLAAAAKRAQTPLDHAARGAGG